MRQPTGPPPDSHTVTFPDVDTVGIDADHPMPVFAPWELDEIRGLSQPPTSAPDVEAW
jgi:hypothetical protein